MVSSILSSIVFVIWGVSIIFTHIIISTSGRTSTFASTSTFVPIYITLIIIPLNFVGTLVSLVSPYLVTNVAKPRVVLGQRTLGSPVSCKLVAAVAVIGPVSHPLLSCSFLLLLAGGKHKAVSFPLERILSPEIIPRGCI